MGTVAVIGGGPAGYVAAITAARQGQHVIVIEQSKLGGTCLNEGCMPTKSLLEGAETYEKVMRAGHFGIDVAQSGVMINWPGMQKYKNTIVNKLVLGVTYLMKKNQIKVIEGTASFLTQHQLLVETADGQETITADRCIIAAGAEPIGLPFADFDGEWIIHSRQAMSLPAIPSSLLIVGGGVIGCEFASIYSRLGTKVTMVEMAEQILPQEDPDIAAVLHKQLEKSGVTVYTGTSVKELVTERKHAILQKNGNIAQVNADYVLVSIGRRPRIAGLGLESIGVNHSKQGIHVDEGMQTNVPHVYACGDVTGGIQLAHVAFHEGAVAASNACGIEAKVDYRAVPRCIYTWPEIAGVGLTEKQARDKYGDILIGEFPFSANGKALIVNEQIGKVKVIAEPEFHEIVGMSIVGPRATELIGQGTVMLHAEMTVDAMAGFIAAHPTLSEAIHEALLSAIGNALHV